MRAWFEAPALPSRPCSHHLHALRHERRPDYRNRFHHRPLGKATAEGSLPTRRLTPQTACEAKSASNDSIRNLLGGLVLAETLQAIAQAPLQRRRRVGIECHEIPQRLAAILAQPSKRRRIGVRMPCHIFANRTIGMFCQLV